MKPWRPIILALLLAVAAGCRTRPEQRAVFDSYQEELRRYEGIIYDLEYENEALCSENQRLKERLDKAALDPSDRRDTGPSILGPLRGSPDEDTPPRSSTTPSSRPMGSGMADEIELEPPVIEVSPTPETPPPSRKPVSSPDEPPSLPSQRRKPDTSDEKPDEETDTSPVIEPKPEPTVESPPPPMLEEDTPDAPPAGPSSVLVPAKPPKQPDSLPPAESLPAPRPSPNSKPKMPELLPTGQQKKVSEIYVDPRHTRGIDLDRETGDDGLRVVIEPRTSSGEVVPLAGKVSIVVLDPSQQGDGARLGHWEFDPQVVEHQIRLAGKRNIPLELPWTGQRPQGSKLSMFIRFETEDGEQLETRHDVQVALPGQISSRWTPRPPQRRGSLTRQIEVARTPRREQPKIVPIPPPVAPDSEVTPVVHEEEDSAELTTPTEAPSSDSISEEVSQRPEWTPYR